MFSESSKKNRFFSRGWPLKQCAGTSRAQRLTRRCDGWAVFQKSRPYGNRDLGVTISEIWLFKSSSKSSIFTTPSFLGRRPKKAKGGLAVDVNFENDNILHMSEKSHGSPGNVHKNRPISLIFRKYNSIRYSSVF